MNCKGLLIPSYLGVVGVFLEGENLLSALFLLKLSDLSNTLSVAIDIRNKSAEERMYV